MGQLDISNPSNVWSEILQKCWETEFPEFSISFQTVFDRFEVLVKNLSQPLKF